ncbi:MAG: hypothetical protein K8S25_05100 [Alphaproteobacteria bacterium]|nr:hypothetical protein [Alphaproteobacteria bacterium]
MTLRIAVAMIACFGLSLALARADGMPEPEDQNFNPVPSVKGVPAPGVPATPQRPAKPAPAVEPVTAPAPPPAPEPTPAPAPTPTPAVTPTASTPPAPPPEAPAPVAQKKTIYEIVNVEVQMAERKPPFITIVVRGTARTGGWKDVELRPLPTFAKEVGMRSFTLVATQPDGPATQALTPVTATIKIDPLPDDVKTIRVLGETNEVAQTFR